MPLLPANAEFIVEGVIKPNSIKSEGPFGEFPGYYGRPEAGCPLVEITAVHYRTSPILTNALMADYPSNEQSGFAATGSSRGRARPRRRRQGVSERIGPPVFRAGAQVM